jgi:hypothetical protein
LYNTGHSVVPAAVPPGTTLYHGRGNSSIPTQPEWLAFDPEHSYIFCGGECHLQTFVTTRELKLAYFDGNSAANLDSGTYDTMDLLLWGKLRPDMVWREWDRAKEACEWGSKWGFDGFVRMEMDLYVFDLFALCSAFLLLLLAWLIIQ